MTLRKVIIFTVLSIFILPTGIAQKSFTPEELRKDMQVLHKKILKYHPSPFEYQDKDAYLKDYENRYQGIDKNLSYLEAYDLMLPMITQIKDLHTSIGFNKKWAKANTKLLPLFIKKYDERYYISYNCSGDTTLVRGYEILAVEGEKVPELIEKVSRFTAPDKGNLAAKQYYAERRFSAYLRIHFPQRDSLNVLFREVKKDSTFNLYIKTMEGKEIDKVFVKRYPTKLRKIFDYEILDSLNKVARLDITTFSLKGKVFKGQKKFKQGLASKMAKIKKDSIQHLILDVRGNGGGSISNIPRVISYFAKENYKLMDSMAVKKKAFNKAFPWYIPMFPIAGRIYFSKNKNGSFVDYGDKKAKYKPSKKHHFDGKVYLLGDAGSYSATVYTSSLMLDLGLADYYGERAGGARWGSFAGRWHNGYLPNTKIRYHIPLFRIAHHIPNSRKESFFIEPKEAFEYEFDDFMNNRDSYERKLKEIILKEIEAGKLHNN